MANPLATLFLDIRARSASIAADFKKAEKQVARFGRDVGRVGQTLTRNFTLPVSAVAALSVREFAKVEQAFAGVRKTVNATPQEFKALEKSIISMSRTLPFASTEIAKVAQISGQLGVRIGDLDEFTQAILEMGVSFDDMNAEEAAIAVARLLNQMGEGMENARMLGNAVTELGNNMAAMEGEILNMTTFMGPAANALGLASTEVAALSAALVALGIRAQAGGTAMSKVFERMSDAAIDGGKKLEAFSKIADVSMEDFANTVKRSPTEAIQLFINGLQRIRNEGGSLTSFLETLQLNNDRTKNSLRALSGGADQAAKAFKLLGSAQQGAGALAREAQKFLATFSNEMKVMVGNVAAIAREIGQILAPIVKAFINGIIALTEAFSGLSPATKKFLVLFTAFAVSIGPVLIGIALLAKGIAFLIGVAGGLGFAGLITKIVAVNTAFATLAALFGSKATEIGQFIDDIVLKWDIFVNRFPNAKKLIGDFIDFALKDFDELREKIQILGEEIKKLAGFISKNLVRALDLLPGVGPGIRALRMEFKSINQEADALKQKAKEQKAAIKTFLDVAKPGLEKLSGSYKDLKDKTKDVISSILNMGTTVEKVIPKAVEQTEEQKKKTKALADEVKRLEEQLQSLNRTTEENSLVEQMQEAAKLGNTVKFDELKERLRQVFFDGALSGISEGLSSEDAIIAAGKLADRQAELTAEAAKEEGFDAAEQVADKTQQEQEDAHRESVAFWENAMENAITGVTFSLEDSLKQVAIGFAAQMAASLTGGFGADFTNLKGLGSSIASSIFGSAAKGGIKDALGIGSGGSFFSGVFGGPAGRPTGAEGPLLENGGFFQPTSGLPAAGIAIAAAVAADAALGVGKSILGKGDSSGTDKAITALNPITAPLAILDIAGVSFGSGKSKAQKMRDELRAKLQEIGFLDGQFRVKLPFSGFDLGAEDFEFGQTFDVDFGRKFASETTAAFDPLGIVLQEQLGLTDALRTQLVGMLVNASLEGATFNEVLLNVKSTYEQFGISVDQTKDAVTQAFLDGKISADQFGAALQNLNALAQDNLRGEGAVEEAINLMAKSIDNPRQALKGLELAFKEASELGKNQFQILGDFIEQRFGKPARDEFEKIENVGVKEFTDFKDLSGDQIFALFDIISKFAAGAIEEFKGVTGEAEGLVDVLDDLDGKKVGVDVDINQTGGSGGGEITPFATGGIVTKPRLFGFGQNQIGIMGEGGPEAIIPLKNMNRFMSNMGKTGGENFTVNIDARGADAGVEQRLSQMMMSMRDQVMDQTLNLVQDFANRTGRF